MAINDCDFIAPGEFSFCARCGRPETCRAGDVSFNCTQCRMPLLTRGGDANAMRALVVKIREEERYGAEAFARRSRLAAERRQPMGVTHGR